MVVRSTGGPLPECRRSRPARGRSHTRTWGWAACRPRSQLGRCAAECASPEPRGAAGDRHSSGRTHTGACTAHTGSTQRRARRNRSHTRQPCRHHCRHVAAVAGVAGVAGVAVGVAVAAVGEGQLSCWTREAGMNGVAAGRSTRPTFGSRADDSTDGPPLWLERLPRSALFPSRWSPDGRALLDSDIGNKAARPSSRYLHQPSD